jgi:hypothetical protein
MLYYFKQRFSLIELFNIPITFPNDKASNSVNLYNIFK